MKIICTEEEKEYIINTIVQSTDCPFYYKACISSIECAGCAEREIEWDIQEEEA